MGIVSGTFQFQLSLPELFWLAGAFGVIRLPLPENSQTGATRHIMQADLDKGNVSLLTRGLIRQAPGFGWQVDRLPSAIIRWLSTADSLLRMDRFPKNGAVRCIHTFTMSEQGMSVEIEGDIAGFILYESRSLLLASLCEWLELPASSSKMETSYRLPQPKTFIPAAWENPKLAEHILKTSDDKAKVKETIAWVKSLETVAIISKVYMTGNENRLASQYIICGDKKLFWGGASVGNNKKVSFVPLVFKEFTAKISDIF